MRLAKYLAHAGMASRRKAEELITSGQVTVNDTLVEQLAFLVNPHTDCVKVNGKPVNLEPKQYILLYKPAGYLSSVTDPFGRPTVMDLIRDTSDRLYPVGRLDFDTEGLLLLTNDGDFTNKMIHPRHQVTKRYRAVVKGRVQPGELKHLEKGVELDDGWTSPARVWLIQSGKNESTVDIEIREGRKRQVKRMFQAIGHPVLHLVRTGFGSLDLSDLAIGQYRYLTLDEVEQLLSLAGSQADNDNGGDIS
ncbi:MAG: pseudouridine synthase [Syntrophomonadaceae bacterium]|jgi:23S rRNA pseudouridine2605 synthase|nr:pseudouridine synthase [Bacillota bacterium]NLM88557.1 rRNA pseudouridine synthase [Syntrophomonadaceae bacterium]HAA09125.1 pseudouridine synthase [Syntrophomonas sp.]HQA49679.1 pseudouridine synthase [Syntrophomonadaceae bacterium]HQD89676.1 pseudouridine synthase [Syntrophomonadaceae bacterium]